MGRIVILVVLVVIAVWLVRRALLPAAKKDSSGKPPLQGDLVACARCGLNLPRAEAHEAGGALFCGDEHAKLGRS